MPVPGRFLVGIPGGPNRSPRRRLRPGLGTLARLWAARIRSEDRGSRWRRTYLFAVRLYSGHNSPDSRRGVARGVLRFALLTANLAAAARARPVVHPSPAIPPRQHLLALR